MFCRLTRTDKHCEVCFGNFSLGFDRVSGGACAQPWLDTKTTILWLQVVFENKLSDISHHPISHYSSAWPVEAKFALFWKSCREANVLASYPAMTHDKSRQIKPHTQHRKAYKELRCWIVVNGFAHYTSPEPHFLCETDDPSEPGELIKHKPSFMSISYQTQRSP